ncbi:unnamed protein product [Paramecium pentaurelia]|uniref:Uncharacterized protein n=1 Tax=Paramecium pentaurelia TaxID=43138 RepID=A0A8S1VI24_9CILI|nr:unnamed protein product [Paramecium pentaurelia]
MQKKPIQRKRLKYEEALKIAAKEDVPLFGQCTKFKERSKNLISIDRVIQFLFLKANNVDRKTALQFANRRLCKIDSTRKYDGPVSYRFMKTSKQLLGSINGWQNGNADVKFNLGSGYTNIQDKHENSFTLKCDTDQRVMTSERDRISMQKYEFSKFNTQRLTQELCKLKEKNKLQNIQSKQNVDFTQQSLFQPFEEQFPQQQQINRDVLFDQSINQRTRAITNYHEKKFILLKKKTISEHQSDQNKQTYIKLYQQLKSNSQLMKRKQNTTNSLQNDSSSRKHSQISFFNLTNKPRLNSNTSISNSQQYIKQYQSNKQQDTFEQKLEYFIKQRLLIQNNQSSQSTIDNSNLNQKLNQYQQMKHQEIKRIQTVRMITQR